MKVNSKEKFGHNSFIKLMGQDYLDNQRIAGKCAAKTLLLLEKLVKEKTTKSLIELNTIAEEYILNQGLECTFKGYKGFPAACCISVNRQLVHGIPTDYKLKEGDLVSFDLGVTYRGSVSDTAITLIYGQPKSELHVKLLEATKECLKKGIESIQIGKQIGVIGNAIYNCARDYGFSVINTLGGHGLSFENINGKNIAIPHAEPFVSNRAEINEGVRIQAGMVIAIEPLLVIGTDTSTSISSDGWTVSCKDICSHEEHSVYIHEDHVEIISNRENL